MKKIILIIIVFCMTGCFGEIGKGIITKECNKQEKINNNTINTNIIIKSQNGTLNTIKISEIYSGNDLLSILNSKKSELNMYKYESGIIININESEVTYDIDVLSASDLVVERFNIKKDTHKMLKNYEDNGYTCK